MIRKIIRNFNDAARQCPGGILYGEHAGQMPICGMYLKKYIKCHCFLKKQCVLPFILAVNNSLKVLLCRCCREMIRKIKKS
jgi:hypothetical protein